MSDEELYLLDTMGFLRVRNVLDQATVAQVGLGRARSHCRFVPPLIHFIPDALTYSVPLFLKRRCDRTLRAGP